LPLKNFPEHSLAHLTLDKKQEAPVSKKPEGSVLEMLIHELLQIKKGMGTTTSSGGGSALQSSRFQKHRGNVWIC
jgi:hypothetical protein